MGGSNSFAACARRLSAELARGQSRPHSSDYERVRSGLIRLLLAGFGALGPDEIVDIADDTLERLMLESRRQGGALENPAGWISTVGANRARDRFRGGDSLPEVAADTIPDDESTRLLERIGTADHVDSAILAAIDAGDDACVQIVTSWVDLADETGEAPSSRAVAEVCGYSHTAVQKALGRFARYLT